MWWQEAVFYHVYPRSFCDTSGTGVGDLNGVRRHLDHLVWLGVDALWLSPVFPSPMADHGYDVSDYCGVDPLFGTLDEMDALVGEAHERGLRVVLDWVPNHTSDVHPWFLAARRSRENPKRDWYIWADGSPDEPPNDWTAAFPKVPAWTWDETTRAWYYHRFTPQQPDLNWANPEVQAAMYGTLQFWLDRGIDGFRIDVAHAIGKDLGRIAAGEGEGVADTSRTHARLRDIRRFIDSRPGDRLALGEVYIMDVEQVASHVGTGPDGDELHMAFNFSPLFLPWDAKEWRSHIELADRAFRAREAWPTWVLSSHDIPRHHTRLGTEARARAAAVLLLGLRGSPFIYAGEELGLEDADVPPEQVQDPAGFRDGCRAPVPWDASSRRGWAGPEPWLPWPPDAEQRNVASMREDRGSILHFYRRLLAARRESPALRWGEQSPVQTGRASDVVAWERWAGGDRRQLAVNLADEARPFVPDEVADRAGGWEVEVASDGVGEGSEFQGELLPSQAVVLRPR